ncbi:hypothetical protein Hanom_Chr07g00668211 [Helianthus anomalus]
MTFFCFGRVYTKFLKFVRVYMILILYNKKEKDYNTCWQTGILLLQRGNKIVTLFFKVLVACVTSLVSSFSVTGCQIWILST